jgi:hypothetical protein
MDFTDKQLKDFNSYVDIQRSGAFNMLDPRARLMTSMDQSEWIFCMKHHEELEAASEAKEA